MSIKSYIQFEPIRFSTALLAFGLALGALISVLATPIIGAAVGGLWAAGVGIFNALFVRNAVTANANVPQVVEDTIKALAPFAPTVEAVVVPVATSPLLPAPAVLHAD